MSGFMPVDWFREHFVLSGVRKRRLSCPKAKMTFPGRGSSAHHSDLKRSLRSLLDFIRTWYWFKSNPLIEECKELCFMDCKSLFLGDKIGERREHIKRYPRCYRLRSWWRTNFAVKGDITSQVHSTTIHLQCQHVRYILIRTSVHTVEVAMGSESSPRRDSQCSH